MNRSPSKEHGGVDFCKGCGYEDCECVQAADELHHIMADAGLCECSSCLKQKHNWQEHLDQLEEEDFYLDEINEYDWPAI